MQRDLAIARELRKLEPDLEIDWFTVDPAARYLEREGERLHPITRRLANESRHFEHVAGEHDLHAFFALRTMDEIMVHNFMTFSDLMEAEHYDLSMQVAEQALAPALRATPADAPVLTDGFSCSTQVRHLDASRTGIHLAQLLERALDSSGHPESRPPMKKEP